MLCTKSSNVWLEPMFEFPDKYQSEKQWHEKELYNAAYRERGTFSCASVVVPRLVQL